MAYQKQEWKEKGEVGAIPISAEHLNHVEEGLVGEETRALEAENSIETEVDVEIARAKDKEAEIESKASANEIAIATEKTRAETKEGELSTKSSTNKTNIEAEIIRAETKEGSLKTEIASKISTSAKGESEGVAPLNASKQVPSEYLPAPELVETKSLEKESELEPLAKTLSEHPKSVIAVVKETTKAYLWRGVYKGTISEDWAELPLGSGISIIESSGPRGNLTGSHITLTYTDVKAEKEGSVATAKSEIKTEIETNYIKKSLLGTEVPKAALESGKWLISKENLPEVTALRGGTPVMEVKVNEGSALTGKEVGFTAVKEIEANSSNNTLSAKSAKINLGSIVKEIKINGSAIAEESGKAGKIAFKVAVNGVEPTPVSGKVNLITAAFMPVAGATKTRQTVLEGTPTFDIKYTVKNGDRFLLMGQLETEHGRKNNGIWEAFYNSGTLKTEWRRPSDFASGEFIEQGRHVLVREGEYANSIFIPTNASGSGPFEVGKDENIWTELTAKFVGSIGKEQIGTESIGQEQLTSESITTEKIKKSAVTLQKLAASSVGGEQLVAGAVTEAKIGEGAVSYEKLTPGVQTKLNEKGGEGGGSTKNVATFQVPGPLTAYQSGESELPFLFPFNCTIEAIYAIMSEKPEPGETVELNFTKYVPGSKTGAPVLKEANKLKIAGSSSNSIFKALEPTEFENASVLAGEFIRLNIIIPKTAPGSGLTVTVMYK